jgi:hypothetical protein
LSPELKPSIIAKESEVAVKAETTINHQKYLIALPSASGELDAFEPKLAINLNIGGQLAKNAVHTKAGINPVKTYFKKL